MKNKTYKKEVLLNPEKDYDISIKELPPIPDFVQEGVKNIGGIDSESGKPILRIRSALEFNPEDDMATFAAEKWYRKYVGAKDHVQKVIGFKVIDKNDSNKQFFLSVGSARKSILDHNNMPTAEAKKKYQILPQLKFETIEYGIPRYVLERFASPAEFGGEKDWEENRWLEITDPLNPKQGERMFDLLGPYPRQGRYVFLTYIEHGIEENGHVVKTEGRLLDQSVLDETAELINYLRKEAEKSVDQRIRESVEALENRRQEKKNKLREEIKEVLSHRSLFLNQPTITVPELPNYSKENVQALVEKAKENVKAYVKEKNNGSNNDDGK
jgi:hypothetical protein